MKKTTVLTSIAGYTTILEPFVRYYKQLGVDRIVMAVFMDKIDDVNILDRLKKLDVSVCKIYDQPYNVKQTIKDRKGYIEHDENEWVLCPDLDEFIVFPKNDMKKYLKRCDVAGIQWLAGKLIDRIACDGSLPVLDPNVDLLKQFPKVYDVTDKIQRAVSQFAVGSVGNNIDDRFNFGWDNCKRCRAGWVDVNHFKWHSGVVARLKDRVATYKLLNNEWWTESQKFLDHIEKYGRII